MAQNYFVGLIAENVRWKMVILAIIIVLLGIGLINFSLMQEFWKDTPVRQALVRELGALLFVSGGITLIWDFIGKRTFLDEIIAKTNISTEIRLAGLLKVRESFQDNEIPWGEYFSRTRHLDIFFAYGRTWRNQHRMELEALISRGAKIRVILPDPTNQQIVKELARRFNQQEEDIVRQINESISDFESFNQNPNRKSVEVYIFPVAPQFSFYIFDDVVVFALYNHARRRRNVLTFICAKGATLYNYIEREFEGMLTDHAQSSPV